MTLAASLVVAVAMISTPRVESRSVDANVPARCTYQGQWAAFNLAGQHGSAAYTFRGGKYLVTLRFAPWSDNRFWVYEVVERASPIRHFAFQRHPYGIGMSTVLRFADDGWKCYERSRYWGGPASESARVAFEQRDRSKPVRYSGSIATGEIGGIAGSNAQKLADAISAALRKSGYRIRETASSPSIVGNKVQIVTAPEQDGELEITHTITAVIERDDKQISLEIECEGFANGAYNEIDPQLPQRIHEKLKGALKNGQKKVK